MKVILNVPDEGYSERTWWRLFQKHVVHNKLDIYVFIITVNYNMVLNKNYRDSIYMLSHSHTHIKSLVCNPIFFF